MRRRKLRWMLAVGLVALVAAGALVLWPRPITPGLTQENFDRVQVGMTLPEVEGLLGHWSSLSMFGPLSYWTHMAQGEYEWRPDDYRVGVGVSIDGSGKVEDKSSHDFLVRGSYSFDSLVWLANRQWRKWFPE
jgi:hypothetical protein